MFFKKHCFFVKKGEYEKGKFQKQKKTEFIVEKKGKRFAKKDETFEGDVFFSKKS